MLRRYAKGLIVLPVLLAAWLVFRTEPVTGLPLNQVVMYEAPEVMSEATDATTGEQIVLN